MPKSAVRVPKHTAPQVNDAIREQMEDDIAGYATAFPADIDDRIAALDGEWDIERVLEANAATLALSGIVLGVTVNRKWLLMSAVIAGFLFQHATQGWCPPIALLRRLGVRTRSEIDEEKYALKALRGDFRDVPTVADPQTRLDVHRVIDAVRR